MDLFEYSATHEIKKSVCIETGPVNWHCILKHKDTQVSGRYESKMEYEYNHTHTL